MFQRINLYWELTYEVLKLEHGNNRHVIVELEATGQERKNTWNKLCFAPVLALQLERNIRQRVRKCSRSFRLGINDFSQR